MAKAETLVSSPSISTSEKKSSLWLPVMGLAWREWVRFMRQPSRIMGALGSPLLFWFLIGSGLGSSFRSQSTPLATGYLEYFFPGTIAMVVLFTAIFSTISIIEDRREGFLQGVLVSPVPRFVVVGGKVLGGAALAFFQAVLFFFLAPVVGISVSVSGIALALLTIALLSVSLTALGFIFAWRLDSVQGFHSVMNLVLFPMWFLSGSLFPASGAPSWLRILMAVNPLTYGVSLLREALYWNVPNALPLATPTGVSLGITVLFGILFFLISTFVVSRPLSVSAGSAKSRRSRK